MNILGTISVLPHLPAPVNRLQELAFNLWWTWNPDAQDLYESIDPELWAQVNENPIRFLRSVSLSKLQDAARNHSYLYQYRSVLQRFDDYMAPDADTWFKRNHPDLQNELIAYFSAEFGLHESLPIYSGGLGILSGDHCKEASDMGLPFVGVGFLYPKGYFTQQINADGWQDAIYENIDFAEMPATRALGKDGLPVVVHVNLPGRTVYARVWKIQIGRVPLYLMDTDVEDNAPADRELTARLYGGDNEMRISQEYVLGIAGVRTLRALGYAPTVWHMNEGHSAFLNLERIREMVQEGAEFDTAVEIARVGSVFTTHTPVPAGHDAFPFDLVDKFFHQYWGQMGIDRERFLALARHDHEWGSEFSMTVLAFQLSAYHNGVSELHGEVSRDMWQNLWPGTPVDQVPIGHITNGVHTDTWLAPELRALYNRYFPSNWLDNKDDAEIWRAIEGVPDDQLLAAHVARKEKLIEFIRERLKRQFLRHGEGHWKLSQAEKALDPRALTIGFARRFATYKRATLVFHDTERLRRILTDPERPVQIVFAGKAHPADDMGKALIQHIYRLSQDPELFGRIVFIENYDMNIARHLVSGVDVWLNTPRRPYEASGTSGQKAALNGAPNFSILDGWWREGYRQRNGWAIGEEREYKDADTQDAADANSLYSILEDEIVPEFYAAGVPSGPRSAARRSPWLMRMRRAIATSGAQFSMRRMLADYTASYYAPAMKIRKGFRLNEDRLARRMSHWKRAVREAWPSVGVTLKAPPPAQVEVGGEIEFVVQVRPGRLSVDDLAVELVVGKGGEDKLSEVSQTVAMQVGGAAGSGARAENRERDFDSADRADQDGHSVTARGTFTPNETGRYSFGVRVRPHHPALVDPLEMGLNTWA